MQPVYRFGGLNIIGSDERDVIFGSFGDDVIDAKEGDDIVFGFFGNDEISGGGGKDFILGGFGNDILVANKGDDFVFGGLGDDLSVWNNGDGSDLMHGGRGDDTVQVNFDTDLANDDLQNKDVAEFSVTSQGVQFARVEVNDQTEFGLFQLDIRKTETLETNFGGGDDAAEIVGTVLDEIKLDLDGGAGIDLLDFSQVSDGVEVSLRNGTADSAHVENFENVIGSEFDDKIVGDRNDNVVSGLGGIDKIFGRGGNDTLVANKGDDFVFGGGGNDLLVWNNGDGSDLMNGGRGDDTVQVNFDTDLVNDDLQNKDVAEFSVTSRGVQFARVEVNDQTEFGLFQLDIRRTETLETNFGGGDDTAKIVADVINEITLELDGGDGVDTLDFSDASGPISVNLEDGSIEVDNGAGQDGSAVNFENVIGTASNDVLVGDGQDNVIRAGSGNDIITGGAGADTFVFAAEDEGVKVILDFEVGVDALEFQTDEDFTATDLVAGLTQNGDDAELDVNGKLIVFEDTLASDITPDAFLIA